MKKTTVWRAQNGQMVTDFFATKAEAEAEAKEFEWKKYEVRPFKFDMSKRAFLALLNCQ